MLILIPKLTPDPILVNCDDEEERFIISPNPIVIANAITIFIAVEQ